MVLPSNRLTLSSFVHTIKPEILVISCFYLHCGHYVDTMVPVWPTVRGAVIARRRFSGVNLKSYSIGIRMSDILFVKIQNDTAKNRLAITAQRAPLHWYHDISTFGASSFYFPIQAACQRKIHQVANHGRRIHR